MDRTGQTLLGKYELTRLLGRGGMGEVWEGEHAITGRRVAVKVLSDKYLSNRKVVKRFGREARAASAVNHPGIVEILDHDRTPEGVPFLVMEFLDGQSLGERLRDKGRLRQDEALAVMLPLLDALGAAHSHGVIHRDLKPDNIYLSPDSRGQRMVKILDFGISQKADEIDHKLTQEGSVLGTPHYMSPEQARGELGIDARADIYAAGVLLYELVVGDVPFDAGNYNALLQTILSTPPIPPRQRGAQISPAVEKVVMASLEKERDRRPRDARTFAELLAQAAEAPDDAVLDVATGRFDDPPPRPPPAPSAGPMRFPAPVATSPSERPVARNSVPSAPPMPDFDADPPSAGGSSLSGLDVAPSPELRMGSEPPAEASPDPFGDSSFPSQGELEAPADLAPLELADDLPRRSSPSGGPALAPDLFDDVQDGVQGSHAAFDFQSTSEGATQQHEHSSFASGRPPSSPLPPRRGGATPVGSLSQPPAPRGAELAARLARSRAKRRASLVRTVGNWVVALVVIAGVVFLVSRMFERDDPRRRQKLESSE